MGKHRVPGRGLGFRGFGSMRFMWDSSSDRSRSMNLGGKV